MRQNANDPKSHASDTTFQLPSPPGENEKLEVYAEYVAALEAFEDRLQAYVGWLKGHALLRTKAVTKAGCDDYATKPIDQKKLIETIQKQLAPAEAASAAST